MVFKMVIVKRKEMRLKTWSFFEQLVINYFMFTAFHSAGTLLNEQQILGLRENTIVYCNANS